MAELDEPAKRLLSVLLGRLSIVVPGRVKSYPRYKNICKSLGFDDYKMHYGRVLEHNGLKVLTDWLIENSCPALTGIIIADDTELPGPKFFTIYNISSDNELDLKWWHDEVQKAKTFAWNSKIQG